MLRTASCSPRLQPRACGRLWGITIGRVRAVPGAATARCLPPHVAPDASAWLARPDRRAHRAELLGLAACVLEGRPGVGVDELPLCDVGVGPLNQQARVLTVEQRTGDSGGPEVDAFARVLGDLVVDHDVGDLQPAAGAQDAIDLVENGVLIGHEVDDAVGDHDID